MSDEATRLRAKLRDDGWVVAIHNDYRLSGVPMTFWLFTRDDRRWIKGEGMDDQMALEAALKESRQPDLQGLLFDAKLTADRENEDLRARLRTAEQERDRALLGLEANQAEAVLLRQERTDAIARRALSRKALERLRGGCYDSVQQAQEIAAHALDTTPVASPPLLDPTTVEACAREALEAVRDMDEKFVEVTIALKIAARIRALASRPPGEPMALNRQGVPDLGFICWDADCKLAHPHEDPAPPTPQDREP